ncbi:MAG TPA: SDR family NAD(P)-dependent oxidoreductase [Mycobacteriales bacterium]|nr:SDR family NAD(P)-dependent oxidoreductase [Mycobacteriales bacterium]
MKIADCSAIVTGGASGLGYATAAQLAEAGAQVVIADLPHSTGADRALDLGVEFVATDVTDAEAVAAAVDAAAALAPLRIVVNCAGVGTPGRVLGKSGVISLEQFEFVVHVNLIGTFNMIRLAAAAMAKTDPIDGERGVIVNTASVAAFDGQVGQAAYAASKGGVVGMTLPIARDLASALIRVVAIAPGAMDTPMLARLRAATPGSPGQQSHPSRLGRPEEYAALARHIVENPMLNGEVIRLDGAIRMGQR